MLNLNKCYLVFALSMNMIRSCLLQYGYSFKIEDNCYSVYMNKTFYGHNPMLMVDKITSFKKRAKGKKGELQVD